MIAAPGFMLLIHLSFSFEIIYPKTKFLEELDQFMPLRSLRKRADAGVYVCPQPCQNGGICIREGVCACQPGFTGERCEKKWDFCTESPISPVNSMVFLNKTHGKVMCVSGFKIDEMRNEYVIECIANSWVYDGKPPESAPQCLPTCKPECQNGGTCFSINKCICPLDYGGEHCEKRLCSNEKPTMQQALEDLNVDSLCPKGYKLDKSRIIVEVVCQNSDWIIRYRQKHCEPVCRDVCQNEGKCVGPNVCLCSYGYSGGTCEKKQCIDNPQNIRNVNAIRNSLNLVTLSCEDGYRFLTGDITMEVQCHDGKWLLPYSGPQCFPVCTKPCVNGGRCVAPDTCKCSEGFTGNYCEKRYFVTVSGESCIFPFEYKGQRFISCTMADRTFPWCATRVDKNGAVIRAEMCYADLGWTKLKETKIGGACFPPFQSEAKKYFDCIHANSSDENSSWCLADSSRMQQISLQNMTEPVATQLCLSEAESSAMEEVIFLNNGEKCPNSPSGEADYHRCLENFNSQPSFCQDIYNKSNGQKFCLRDYGWKKIEVTKNEKSCVYPFFINGGLMVNHCVSLYGEPVWCATMVDTKGMVIEKEECISSQWDYGEYQYGGAGHRMMLYAASKSNPNNIKIGSSSIVNSAGGRQCVFPFWYNNTLHFNCVSSKSEVPWCVTKLNGWEIVESDFCLPNIDSYNEELLKIEYGIRGFKNDEYMREALEKVKSLNEKLLVYPKLLGYQRFLAMLMGERVHNSPPHRGPTLKYFDSDEHLREVIKKYDIPSEADLKDKGITEMLGLFGRRCCQMDKNQQVKVDFHREQLRQKAEFFLRKRNISVPEEILEAYGFVLRNLLESDEIGPNEMTESVSTPTHVVDSTLTFPTTKDLFETTTMPYDLGISQEIAATTKELMKSHRLADFLIPTAQSGERCQPFLLNGLWYGYGGCIKRENGHHSCAVLTNHKGEAVRFENCLIQTENPGFWPPFVQNPTTYPERNIMVTTASELCFFPFKINGNWYESCIQSEKSPYGRCAISVDENWKPLEMQDCDPFEGTMKSLSNASVIPSLSESISGDIGTNFTHLTLEGRLLMVPERKTTALNNEESQTILSAQNFEESTSSSVERIGSHLAANDIIPTLKKETSYYTSKGEKCLFPFSYKGVLYKECITVDEVEPWCPTEISMDGTPMFGDYCQGKNEAIRKRHNITFSVDGFLCQFPMKFQGQIYQGCIESEHIRPWCKVYKDNGDGEGSPAECRGRENVILKAEPPLPRDVYTVSGKRCIFPFRYHENVHLECISDESLEAFWCATEIDSKGHVIAKESCATNGLKWTKQISPEIYRRDRNIPLSQKKTPRISFLLPRC